MNPEKAVVNLWLNRQGFFTMNDINAGSKVVDVLAIKQGAERVDCVQHVEVSCSITPSVLTGSAKQELLRRFNDDNVVKKVKASIREYTGREYDYEKVLVSTNDVEFDGVKVVRFDDVLFDVVNGLDRQYYKNSVLRTMQLVKYLLLANPENTAKLLSKKGDYKPLTYSEKELLMRELLGAEGIKGFFRKKENEALLVELIKESTLRQPERLAEALQGVMAERTATRFFNVLLQKREVQEAVKEESMKDKKLAEFFK